MHETISPFCFYFGGRRKRKKAEVYAIYEFEMERIEDSLSEDELKYYDFE